MNEYYNEMKKMPKQDNKTYIVKSNSSYYNLNKIRYPKKCRKTAWKHFYKLFSLLDKEKKSQFHDKE